MQQVGKQKAKDRSRKKERLRCVFFIQNILTILYWIFLHCLQPLRTE